eukprot:TRINITY_DN4170_c0_g1_i1.p1 TRINITY_DN4170_c0_g1~~TRINITY_DN4170_c0_g1_i1.p1  ORF type:complete len:163 (-),score=28.37 TRINITY_DN4170_c0_g1_i1:298-786(-)
MLKTSVIVLGFCACAFAAPQNRVIDLLNEELDDSINIIDDTNPKELEFKDQRKIPEDIPLGSQFAVGFLFPERVGVVTGHRIPLELFPVETQAQILEVPAPKKIDESKYVDSSSFRQQSSLPTSPAATPELRLEESVLSGLTQETDKHYEGSLRVFAPPAFF